MVQSMTPSERQVRSGEFGEIFREKGRESRKVGDGFPRPARLRGLPQLLRRFSSRGDDRDLLTRRDIDGRHWASDL